MSVCSVTFADVTAADFEELAALRILAMRASLEQVGRFDPERARDRLRKSFHPEHTQFILCDGQRIGFYTFRPDGGGFALDHFYIHPDWQSRGLGSSVMRSLLAQADACQMPIYLGALRESGSNRFYRRHGFTKINEDEWDIYYVRTPLIVMNQSRATHPPVIRQATPNDASAIEGLYRELVSDPLIGVVPEQIAALSASPASFLLVAEAEGAVCATTLLTICPDIMYRTQPFGVVENVVVTPAMRGCGLGRLLLAHVEQLAISHDCTKLMLLSGATREAAHKFFRHCGFTSDTKHAFVKYRRQFGGQ